MATGCILLCGQKGCALMHLPNNISAVSLSGEPEVLFRHPVFAKLLRREVQQFLIVQLSFVPLEVIHCPTIGYKEIRVA